MKVLLLSPYPKGLMPALDYFGDKYTIVTDPISLEYCLGENFEFLVSYGYRHILDPDVISLFHGKAINLHISLLPFCRGAHPVFWSIVEGRPFGVTIHLLDSGLDTGDILLQQAVPLNIANGESFASLYEQLRTSIELLFCYNWKWLRAGECSSWPQQGSATIHRSRELDSWLAFMPKKWETSVLDFCRLARIYHPRLSDS